MSSDALSDDLRSLLLLHMLYFVKFWRQTGDRLFAASFVLLFLERVALALATDMIANTAWYYVIRLLAFALIIVAIIDKNRAQQR